MKKLRVVLLLLAGFAFQGCSYDDQPLWDAVEDLDSRVDRLEQIVNKMNGEISDLQKIIAALQNEVTVQSVDIDSDGYTIRFSDGTFVKIKNGKNGQDGKDGQDGQDGQDAPMVSVKRDMDGVYYWTLDGKWLLDGEGNKIPVEGKPGEDGQNAPIPQIRVNTETGEWEISVDGGENWEQTGFFIDDTTEGDLFKSVDNSHPDYVIIVLSDDTEIRLDRYTEDEMLFAIEGNEGLQEFRFGEVKTYSVTSQGVQEYSISKPEGWKVSFDGTVLTVTAITEDNVYGERTGVISFHLVSEQGKGRIVNMEVEAKKMYRILTFEDQDWKGNPYRLDYCDREISTWSDLIDDPQYGGQMLYGDYQNAKYEWKDEGNTYLSHVMPKNYNAYCYWGGGHAISNYQEMNLKNGDFTHQLAVYYTDPVTGKGGHNGSDNFCVHYGYIDGSPFNMTEFLPALEFSDNVARVIDHMYVMNTTYNMNCYLDGNGLTAKIGPDDWVKLVATGYDTKGQKTGEVEIYMVNGPDNIVSEWTKWDLSSLGKIVKIDFNVTGSSDNGYGFSQPAYFAYDDIAVEF